MKRILEICIDSIESGVIAQRAGADRVEICDNLYEGGTTPSLGMIRVARKALSLSINVIIRPRGGDFLYSKSERAIMKEDIRIAKEEGVDGFVLGVLTPEGHIDIENTSFLIERCAPLPVTFHRAFDMSVDPMTALADVISCKATRLLTSGHKNLAIDDTALLSKLIQTAGNDLIIMPGSGINENNIAGILNETDAQEIHLTGRAVKSSMMRFRKDDIFMGGLAEIPEYDRKIADESRLRKIREIIDSYE